MIDINSSALKSVAYEVNSLFVLFNTGELWEYADVPYNTFLAMLESDSKGKFFNVNVRSKFKGVCYEH